MVSNILRRPKKNHGPSKDKDDPLIVMLMVISFIEWVLIFAISVLWIPLGQSTYGLILLSTIGICVISYFPVVFGKLRKSHMAFLVLMTLVFNPIDAILLGVTLLKEVQDFATVISYSVSVLSIVGLGLTLAAWYYQYTLELKAEWETTTPGLCDAAQRIMLEGNSLFKRKDFASAITRYTEAKMIYQKAYAGSKGLKDKEMNSTILKNIRTCEKDVLSCEVAIDKGKVEDLIKEANSHIKSGKDNRTHGRMFKAREEFNKSNNILEDAFQIANKRELKDGITKLTAAMNVIREELISIDKEMASGVKPVGDADTGIAGDLEPVKDRAAPADTVHVSSDYDYKGGHVRLFTGIINLQDSIITDATIRLFFDENYLRIDNIIPKELGLHGHDVDVGTVAPGEKKVVEFFLDPMVCQTLNVDGELTYKDSKGKFHTSFMKQQVIGIQCPVFASAETINTATAINLATQVLKHKDVKVFLIPPKITPREIYQIAKEVVQTRDVKHVSDIFYKKGFGVMVYYYGRTKGDEQFIFRITVLEETNSIELFVACDQEPMLTGELGKLTQEFNERLMKERVIRQPIQHVNISIKGSVLQRSQFIFKDGTAVKDIEIRDSVVIRSKIGDD